MDKLMDAPIIANIQLESIKSDQDSPYIHRSNSKKRKLAAFDGHRPFLSKKLTRSISMPSAQVQRPNGSKAKPYIIGVVGGTNSGKSSVCKKIITELNNLGAMSIVAISQDSFYRDLEPDDLELAHKSEYNFDHPKSIDDSAIYELLIDLCEGRPGKIPIYDFKTHRSTGEFEPVQPAEVILLEGIMLFYYKKIREICDMKLYIDCDADTRLARRVSANARLTHRKKMKLFSFVIVLALSFDLRLCSAASSQTHVSLKKANKKARRSSGVTAAAMVGATPKVEAMAKVAAVAESLDAMHKQAKDFSILTNQLPTQTRSAFDELIGKLKNAKKLNKDQKKVQLQMVDAEIHKILGNEKYKAYRAIKDANKKAASA